MRLLAVGRLASGFVAAFFSMILSGCSGGDVDDAGSAVSMPMDTIQRRFVNTAWDTLWTAGGEQEPDLLLYPNGLLAADADNVYVLDPGEYRVTALATADGRVEWMRGRRGRGPGEYESLRGVSVAPTGEVHVLDPDQARVTIYDRSGAFARTANFADLAGATFAACSLGDGSHLVLTGEAGTPLRRIGEDGEPAARIALPWQDLNDGSPLLRHGTLVPDAHRGGCVLLMTHGRGLARFDENTNRFGAPLSFAEVLSPPVAEVEKRNVGGREVTTHRIPNPVFATAHASIDGDELAILFVGATPRARRLIDLHDAASGAYRETVLLPFAVEGMARAAGVYYVTYVDEGYARLAALRPRSTSGAG